MCSCVRSSGVPAGLVWLLIKARADVCLSGRPSVWCRVGKCPSCGEVLKRNTSQLMQRVLIIARDTYLAGVQRGSM